MRLPEQYPQGPGTPGATGSGWRDAHALVLRERGASDPGSGAVRTSVAADEAGRYARSRVVDAHRFRERGTLGRIRVAVHAAHRAVNRVVASHLRNKHVLHYPWWTPRRGGNGYVEM